MRLDAAGKGRRRIGNAAQLHRPIRRAQRIAADRFCQLDNRTNIAGTDIMDRRLFLSLDAVELPDALFLARTTVEHVGVGVHLACIDANIAELADMRVDHRFENQGGQWLVIAGVDLDRLVVEQIGGVGDFARSRGNSVQNRVQQLG